MTPTSLSVETDSNVSIQTSNSNQALLEATSQIMSKLDTMSNQISSLDGRVRANERALASQTATPAVSATATAVPSGTSVAAARETVGPSAGPSVSYAPNVDQSVVPSVDFIRNNPEVQQNVDHRVSDLRKLNEHHTQGNLYSQRGGSSKVAIKKAVGWPQNYVLVGPNREQPEFDDLSPTQFFAGCLWAALDLPANDKDRKIEYLANLMGDA